MVDSTLHLGRVDEVVPQVGNVLQEEAIQPQAHVVEQHQVLVELTHVAYVRDYRKAELPREQDHGKELADAGHAHRVYLDEPRGSGLHEVLEQNDKKIHHPLVFAPGCLIQQTTLQKKVYNGVSPLGEAWLEWQEMAGYSKSQSSRDEALMAALLVEPTIAAAAQRAGMPERTVYRRLASPDFAEVYRQVRRDAVSHAGARLQAASGRAVGALIAILEDPSASATARVAAAKAVLETAFSVTEQEEVTNRLDTLEAMVTELNEASTNGRTPASR